MSTTPPGSHWQRPELAHSFLEDRSTLLPLLDAQEDLIRELLSRHPIPAGPFLDLGAGDGAMSALALSVHPSARPVLVDISEPMLARAERRLGEPAVGRWQAVHADLSAPSWQEALPAGPPYAAALSSFAIHHLPSARKAALFSELYDILAPGAIFINMDVVTVLPLLTGIFDERITANAIAAERRRGGPRSDEEVAAEILSDSPDDRPDSADLQLEWLRSAGFEDVELHFKWAEGAVYAAVKPAEGS